jgi:hypothetical protein
LFHVSTIEVGEVALAASPVGAAGTAETVSVNKCDDGMISFATPGPDQLSLATAWPVFS